MKRNKNASPLFAVCVDNTGYPALLEQFKLYQILPDDVAASDGDLRVIDESGEDYLYSADRFVLMVLPKAVIEKMQPKRKRATVKRWRPSR
ncbi:hypothetical protein HUU05_16885 [candidate division KSB1 bacterium]|nr:hypothetical protein [candidate division KSB1 bacterium]